MAKFITPAIKMLFAQTMADLRSDIGRNVTVVMPPTTIMCPNCKFDNIGNRSSNKYEPADPYPLTDLANAGVKVTGPVNFNALGMRTCPVCNGVGKIPLAGNEIKVLCLINEIQPDEADPTPLGKHYKVNYELQAAIAYMDYFRNAQKVIIDGAACEVVRVVPQGIGDLSQVSVYAGG